MDVLSCYAGSNYGRCVDWDTSAVNLDPLRADLRGRDMSFFHSEEFTQSLRDQRELKLSLKDPTALHNYSCRSSRNQSECVKALQAMFKNARPIPGSAANKRKPELAQEGFREVSVDSPDVKSDECTIHHASKRRRPGRRKSGGKRGEESTADEAFSERHSLSEKHEKDGFTTCPANLVSWVIPAPALKAAEQATEVSTPSPSPSASFAVNARVRGKIIQFDDQLISTLPVQTGTAVKKELCKAAKHYDRDFVVTRPSTGANYNTLRAANCAARETFKQLAKDCVCGSYDPFGSKFVIQEDDGAGVKELLFEPQTPACSALPTSKEGIGKADPSGYTNMFRFESVLLHQIDSDMLSSDMFNVCSLSLSVDVSKQ